MTARKRISSSELITAYIDERLSISQCADRFKVSGATIHRLLKASGVVARPFRKPPGAVDRSTYLKVWRQDNRAKVTAYNRVYKEANKCALAERERKRYAANRQGIAARAKQRYNANPERHNKCSEAARARRRAKDEAGFKAARAEYVRKRRKQNSQYALTGRMSNMIRRSLCAGKQGRSWRSMVPYTLSELRRRLDATMPPGYSWDDFLTGDLHIDHEIPVRAFNFSSPEDYDFKRCWALKNLRLLPSSDNLKKGGRLGAPFQPSLF